MLTVNNLSYSINGKQILSNISEKFETNKINLIIGPNGAGKSTFIKAICGELNLPNASMIQYDNNISLKKTTELAKIRAVLSQNVEVNFPLKVKEIVMMGRHPHFSNFPSKKDEAICEEAMAFFDLEGFENREFYSLSGGEKQRVHFARVMTQIWHPIENQTRYLILDEPLTFLDVNYQYNFMYKIQEIAKQKNIVIIGVLHDLNLTAKFADKIILLKKGEIIASGNKNDVLTEANIHDAYQMNPKIYSMDNQKFISF